MAVKKFDKNEAEHEIRVMKLKHSFALKMAIMICVTVVSSVILLGILFGAVTPISIAVLIIVGIIFGIVSFSITRSGLM